MGEYADLYYREEVKKMHGFDPGSMYSEKKDNRPRCPKCGKKLANAQGIADHMRMKHEKRENSHE